MSINTKLVLLLTLAVGAVMLVASFLSLRQREAALESALRDELQQTDASRNAGLNLRELSMGMSGDFIPAIEEGATMVRIGSRIFVGL